MRFIGGSFTDIGSTRAVNQDAVFYRCLKQGKECFALGAVCDGIGGLEHGELASGLIKNLIGKWFEEIAAWLDIASADASVLNAHLKDAAEDWNEQLYIYCQENNIRTGTTMSVLMAVRDRYYIIHAGDSRIYRYHSRLEQLTVDSSIMRMKNGRMKSYLDNYMGKKEELWYQAIEGEIVPGDMFLLCSDGMYHCMTEEDVCALYKKICSGKEVEAACSELVFSMIRRGERDNISLGILYGENQTKSLFRK